MALATLALLAQMAIDSSVENIASACIVYASSMMVFLYLSWSKALDTQPLSSFVVLGFCVTTQFGALLVQTIAWTPLVFSLYDPLYTFGILAFYQAIAVAVHAAYCYLSSNETSADGLVRSMLKGICIYRTPSAGSLWLMGCIGLLSFVASGGQAGAGGQASEGVIISKFVQSFHFFAWAPFLIPFFLQQKGDSYCNSQRLPWTLAFYVLLIALVGIARNARGVIFVGAVTVALIYLLHFIRSDKRVTSTAIMRLGVMAMLGALLMQPLTDLVNAMTIARNSRNKLTGIEMIGKTIEVLKQPALIAAFKAKRAPKFSLAYDETYIANPMLGRLIETKFHDNALHFGRGIVTEEGRARLWQVTEDRFLAVLPSPVLEALDINIKKADARFSMGDYLVYLSKGARLGSYRTGSLLAQGIALWGFVFPFVYALGCLVVFQLLGLWTTRANVGSASVAALGMMQIWWLFQHGLVSDSIGNVFDFIVRGFPQMVLEYAMVFAAASFFSIRKHVSGDGRDTWEVAKYASAREPFE